MSHLTQLISTNASASIGQDYLLNYGLRELSSASAANTQLEKMLRLRNGFMAFSLSLHVFPYDSAVSQNIVAWNEEILWKNDYQLDLPEFCCFGENLFGEQFCFCDGKVFQFDPETGKLAYIADTIEEWAQMVLDDTDYMTGRSLAQQWQAQFGPLNEGCRLVPRVPFVCGGDYAVENLCAMEALRSMKYRASLANQIVTLPDGAQIQFEILD